MARGVADGNKPVLHMARCGIGGAGGLRPYPNSDMTALEPAALPHPKGMKRQPRILHPPRRIQDDRVLGLTKSNFRQSIFQGRIFTAFKDDNTGECPPTLP
jgi:hypothetical protein